MLIKAKDRCDDVLKISLQNSGLAAISWVKMNTVHGSAAPWNEIDNFLAKSLRLFLS